MQNNNIVDTVTYKFFYKDKFGVMQNETIEISENNNELAIAKFEKLFPDVTWRSFIKL